MYNSLRRRDSGLGPRRDMPVIIVGTASQPERRAVAGGGAQPAPGSVPGPGPVTVGSRLPVSARARPGHGHWHGGHESTAGACQTSRRPRFQVVLSDGLGPTRTRSDSYSEPQSDRDSELLSATHGPSRCRRPGQPTSERQRPSGASGTLVP
jgi:hypothetical protein